MGNKWQVHADRFSRPSSPSDIIPLLFAVGVKGVLSGQQRSSALLPTMRTEFVGLRLQCLHLQTLAATSGDPLCAKNKTDQNSWHSSWLR